MASTPNGTPASRRHSFSTFGSKHHHHKPIPTTATSHPNDPIPAEPKEYFFRDIPSPRKRQKSLDGSPRSSGENVSLFDDDGASDRPDTPHTPLTEPHDLGELGDKLRELPIVSPNCRRKRRASTTYAGTADEIKRMLGDGSGTKFFQKLCCGGGGACMLEPLPAHLLKAGIKPVSQPENDAYKFLNLNVGALTLDTELRETAELPEQNIDFQSIRRESIAQKFPLETEHDHGKNAVNTTAPAYMKPHPPYDIFSAPLYGARELTKPGAEKRTFHFDIDVTDYPVEGGVDFKVGGAIGVCPPSDPTVVEDIMNQLCIPRFQRDKPIRLQTGGGRWPTIWGDEEARELVTTRREILTWTIDISSTPPTKPFLRLLAEHATNAHEKQILLFLTSKQGQAAFCDLRTGPHVTLQQMLHAFPSSKPPLEELCGVLPQLMPRFYSLSNDPHISSDREGLSGRRLVEVAVTVHKTDSYNGSRSGVGSGFLERIAGQFMQGELKSQTESCSDECGFEPGVAGRALDLRIPMFRGLMANPLSREFASDGPMVLVGAGVGMAPFRGFILNRVKNANCANKIWLIQGIRDRNLDELYAGELGEYEEEIKKIVQSRVVQPQELETDSDESESDGEPAAAPSDQKITKYVQDELRVQADVVWFAINASDGRIFVCGSSGGMGEGVADALIDIAMDKGHMDLETARQFWSDKKEAGQYIAETW